MTPLVRFVMAWVSGLLLAQAFDFHEVWFLLAFPPAAALVIGWGDRRWARIAATLLLGLSLGGLRLTAGRPALTSNHVATYRGAGEVGVVGVIVADPDRRSQDTRLRVRAEQVVLADGTVRAVRGRLLVYAPPYSTVAYGDRVRVEGRLEEPPVFAGFSYRDYLAREGIYAMLRTTDAEILAHHQANRLLEALLRARLLAHERLMSMLPDDAGALLAGILLGMERGISDDVNEAFAVTGTSHIVAISGFNLTIAASVVAGLARHLSHRKAVLFVSLGVIWAYVFLVGAPAAVTRAGAMSSLIVLAQTEQRRVHGPTSLAAAVLALTLWNPFTLWDVGFQLSVGAMLALIFYVPLLERLSTRCAARLLGQPRAERLVGLLSDVLIVTLAVQITTLGIMVSNFESLSLIAPLANLLVLPVQPAVMLFGALALGTGFILPPLGSIAAWIVWVFLKYTLWVVAAMSRVPYASVPLPDVGPTAVWAYYVVLTLATWALTAPPESRRQAWAWLKGTKPALRAGGAAAGVLAVLYGVTQPDGQLHAFFLDAGGGDAILIVTPTGRRVLVDGGADPPSLATSLGKHMPFWDRGLEMVLLTSPDENRIAGLIPVLERYDVAFVGTSPEPGDGAVFARWSELLRSRASGSWGVLTAGASFQLDDGVTLDVLWPDPGVSGPLVLRLTYRDASFLLMGDATATVEEALVGVYGPALRSDVLQLPRGGDKSCCGRSLLQTVAPQIAVVAPRTSAPLSSLVMARLMDLPLYRIDQTGTVEMITNGERVRVRARTP